MRFIGLSKWRFLEKAAPTNLFIFFDSRKIILNLDYFFSVYHLIIKMFAFLSLNQGLINSTKISQKKIGVSSLCAQLAPNQPFINSKQIKEVREKYKLHDKDTGSPEYQIAALTVRISYMTEHVKRNPKDYSSTRGLIAMVNARKKLLSYLRKQNKDRFLKVCVGLNIRIAKNQL